MRLLITIFIVTPFLTFSQLVTNMSQGPASLVQNVLLGPGVTVSNITYSGANGSIGYFSAAGTNLGIAEGIVMTTGTVANNGNGPHGPNNSDNSGMDNGAPGYSRLSSLVGGTATFNRAVLEFDFVPYSDTVRFSYVFGSEEYREYVNSQYNDVFAFFISGPGIPGGSKNMALLPNGTPVTINNVNDGSTSTGPYVAGCMNCAYFKYNGSGSEAPYNQSSTYLQYDGLTKPLEAVAKVQCGQTYHLVIALADVGDPAYDSGIFLQANSLSSKVPVAVQYQMSYDAFNDPSMMAEGCVSTTVTLTRTKELNVPLTIPINVSGTATPGVDYSPIPSSITFPPGQGTVQFTFDALQDGIVEGIETLNLVFQIPDPCGGHTNLPINLKINDIAPVTVVLADTNMICPGTPIELIPIVSGGVGPYVYNWSTNETTSSISVSPAATQTYTVSVTDNCLHETATDAAIVTVPVYLPLAATSSPDITEICPYLPKTLSVTAIEGAGFYTYQWFTDDEQLGTAATQDVIPSKTTTYNVTVTDRCGNSVSEQIVYTITSPPLLLSMSPDRLICPGDSAFIFVTATGGWGQYYYNWVSLDGLDTPEAWVNPYTSTTYTVSVSDECQTFTVQGNAFVEVIKPVADFRISSRTLFEDLPITFQNLTYGGVSYEWEFGDGHQSTLVHPNNTYDTPGTYWITLIATNQIGCKDTVRKPITILPEWYIYVPNAFTPDENRLNNYFSVSTVNIIELNVQIFNRWGEKIFESDDIDFAWDGSYKGNRVQDGVYVYKITYKNILGTEDVMEGHVVLIK